MGLSCGEVFLEAGNCIEHLTDFGMPLVFSVLESGRVWDGDSFPAGVFAGWPRDRDRLDWGFDSLALVGKWETPNHRTAPSHQLEGS